MNRTPPSSVIRQLRTEVGFGCPVLNCGNPYLEWHHFDPPWSVEQHHKPEGMVALCAEHHKKADNGAYTNDQLAAFKRNKVDPATVSGRFEWRRNKLLAIVGGNFYYETPRILVIDGQDVVAVSRDEEGYLLLTVHMLSLSREERIVLVESCWENIGFPVDLLSPPNGKKLSVSYENGDYLNIEFSVVADTAAFLDRFGREVFEGLEFPLTTVEVNCRIGGTDIALTPAGTSIATNKFIGCFMSNCGAGLMINLGMKWRQNWCLVPDPGSRLSPCPCGSGNRYKHCHGSLV
jgi:SEC-C motif